MPWDSQDPSDEQGRVVWWTRLDQRYQVEVHRKDDNVGTFLLWDRGPEATEPPRLLREEEVGLAYGAPFGPDEDDVNTWQEMVLRIVDGQGG